MISSEEKVGTGAHLFSNKTGDLNEIGKLPKQLWSACVSVIMENTNPDGSTSWSRQLVSERVSEAKDFLKEHEIPKEWQDYLEPVKCALVLQFFYLRSSPAVDFAHPLFEPFLQNFQKLIVSPCPSI